MAILLAYGRLYVDSEMTVLQACGVSQKQLLNYTLTFASVVFVLVLAMNFYITPWLVRDKEKILATNPATIIINTLVPGRFKSLNDQNVVYVGAGNKDHVHIRHALGYMTALIAGFLFAMWLLA